MSWASGWVIGPDNITDIFEAGDFLLSKVPEQDSKDISNISHQGNLVYMGWDLHIAPENITYLYEFDLVLGPLIPGMGSKI